MTKEQFIKEIEKRGNNANRVSNDGDEITVYNGNGMKRYSFRFALGWVRGFTVHFPDTTTIEYGEFEANGNYDVLDLYETIEKTRKSFGYKRLKKLMVSQFRLTSSSMEFSYMDETY